LSIGIDDLCDDISKEDGEKKAKEMLIQELEAAVNDIVSPKSIQKWNSNKSSIIARDPLPGEIGNGLTFTRQEVS